MKLGRLYYTVFGCSGLCSAVEPKCLHGFSSWFCTFLFYTDPSVLRGPLLGHTDAVWGLAYSAAHQRLLSCSADGTLRLWSTTEVAPALSVFNDNQGTVPKIKPFQVVFKVAYSEKANESMTIYISKFVF